MKKQFDYAAFTAYVLEENILHIEMKKIKELSAKDIEQINDCFHEIGNGKKVYVLVTFLDFISISDEAIRFAIKNNIQKIIGAVVYVVDNLGIQIGVKFFINFHKRNYPINIFETKSEAILWLKETINMK